jgi:hypothetical protein
MDHSIHPFVGFVSASAFACALKAFALRASALKAFA